MTYCESCAVKIEGSHERCPLCGGVPSPIEGRSYETFPKIRVINPKKSLLYRLLKLCTVATATIAVGVNYAFQQFGWWSLFVLAGLGCGWLCLFVFIRKWYNPLKALSWQLFVGVILSILWDIGTGWHRWSIEIVMPILILSAMVTTLVLVLALHIPVTESFIYLIFISTLGLIPGILIFIGYSRFIILQIICVVASIIYLAALITLEGKPFKAELERRFHL